MTRSSISPLHRLWRMLPARARRRALGRLVAALAPRPQGAQGGGQEHDQGGGPPPAAGGVAVGGEFSRSSGLGEGARLMLAALEELGIPAWQVEPGRPLPPALPPHAPLVLHANAPVLPLALLRLPRGLVRGRRVVGYWAWELPVVPAAWRAGVPFVHEVWAPSRFTADALEPLLPGRVRVVPHPLAAAPPRPAPLGRADFGLPEAALVVLVSFNLASSFERKNPLGAIAAFRAAFGDRPDRVLLLKLGNPGHFPEDFRRIEAAVAGAANIRIDTREMPGAERHALTAAADIVLSLHRSEGFGLVPAEAMLLGRPVVATGWSGNMEFMDAASAALVPFRLIPARDPRGVFEAPGAVWADPDIGAAAVALRRLADDPAARAALGAAGKAMAEARLGAGPLAAALAAIGVRA
jgi:glycosyltransferase involved in cell wall biosynthesis